MGCFRKAISEKKIPPKHRSGLIFEGLRPEPLAEYFRGVKGDLPQTLKDQTTGKERSRYRLEEMAHVWLPF